jgi:hypothetical protein
VRREHVNVSTQGPARGSATGGSLVTRNLRISLARLILAPLACASVAAHSAEPRSAQGDCTREAQRRGYQVLQTSNFQQYDEGWTLDMRVRYRTGRTDTGTCFVDNRTGRVNLFNFNEGSTGGSGAPGTMRFRCESFDSRYRECQIPIEGEVKRLPRLSEARCDENRSWGRRGDRIWVDHGCRSDFEVTSDGWDGGGGNNPGQQQRAEAACRNEAKRQFMTLTRLLPATHHDSYWRSMLYGTVRGQQVQGDCRFDPRSNDATIFIQPYGGGGGGSGSHAQLATRACADQSRRLGFGVQHMSTPQGVSGGYRIAMTLLRGQDRFAANCSYRSSNGRAEIDQVLPQPR